MKPNLIAEGMRERNERQLHRTTLDPAGAPIYPSLVGMLIGIVIGLVLAGLRRIL